MKLKRNTDLLKFLKTKGYRYFLSRIHYDEGSQKFTQIDLIPVTRKPEPGVWPFIFSTYFAIDRDPGIVFAAAANSNVNICICLQDLIDFNNYPVETYSRSF